MKRTEKTKKIDTAFVFKLTEDDAEEFERICDERDDTRSQVLRRFVKEFISKNRKG
jgi:hypothetical protein